MSVSVCRNHRDGGVMIRIDGFGVIVPTETAQKLHKALDEELYGDAAYEEYLEAQQMTHDEAMDNLTREGL